MSTALDPSLVRKMRVERNSTGVSGGFKRQAKVKEVQLLLLTSAAFLLMISSVCTKNNWTPEQITVLFLILFFLFKLLQWLKQAKLGND